MMNKAIDVDVISIETACPICGHEYTAVFADHELAQLRADLQAAQEHIVEQARQIDEAQEILLEHRVIDRRIEPWLAANPAPEAEHVP